MVVMSKTWGALVDECIVRRCLKAPIYLASWLSGWISIRKSHASAPSSLCFKDVAPGRDVGSLHRCAHGFLKTMLTDRRRLVESLKRHLGSEAVAINNITKHRHQSRRHKLDKSASLRYQKRQEKCQYEGCRGGADAGEQSQRSS